MWPAGEEPTYTKCYTLYQDDISLWGPSGALHALPEMILWGPPGTLHALQEMTLWGPPGTLHTLPGTTLWEPSGALHTLTHTVFIGTVSIVFKHFYLNCLYRDFILVFTLFY